ncbi:MAG: hypothetical protein LBV50_12360 [Novosphingobium sp.]|jgi:hypothetical protein|nr:hypothetical protein [Novosphingobium sp.]
MKKLTPVLAGILLGTLALGACSKGGDKPAGGGDEKPATEETAAAGGEAGGTSAGGTGVAECDDYLTKLKACIDNKVPAAAREQVASALEQTKKSWAAISDKGALASACKQATEAAKASYKAMGCEF